MRRTRPRFRRADGSGSRPREREPAHAGTEAFARLLDAWRGVSLATVAKQARSIFDKLGVSSRGERAPHALNG